MDQNQVVPLLDPLDHLADPPGLVWFHEYVAHRGHDGAAIPACLQQKRLQLEA